MDKPNPIATPMPDHIEPKILTAWREAMGYTKMDAAAQLGCSRTAWSQWETGLNKCPRYIGLAMAALAVDMDPFGHVKENGK